jgi:hypothetical protein
LQIRKHVGIRDGKEFISVRARLETRLIRGQIRHFKERNAERGWDFGDCVHGGSVFRNRQPPEHRAGRWGFRGGEPDDMGTSCLGAGEARWVRQWESMRLTQEVACVGKPQGEGPGEGSRRQPDLDANLWKNWKFFLWDLQPYKSCESQLMGSLVWPVKYTTGRGQVQPLRRTRTQQKT